MVDAGPALPAILRRVEGVAPGEGGGVLPGDGAQHVLIRRLAHFPSRGAQPVTTQDGLRKNYAQQAKIAEDFCCKLGCTV